MARPKLHRRVHALTPARQPGVDGPAASRESHQPHAALALHLPRGMQHSIAMAAFFSLSALAACAPSHPDEVAFRVAGASATYCNLANEGAPEAVAPCAIEAWREGRPFVVRQTPRGIDSEVFEYFVSAGGGRVQKLSSDRLIARPGVAGYLRVTAQECTNVRVERVDGADTLACDAAGPLQCIEGC